MINYTIAEFLGIFLLGFPVLIFATIITLWGLWQLVERFFEDPTDKTIFHHHFHHKDRTYAPPRSRGGDNL